MISEMHEVEHMAYKQFLHALSQPCIGQASSGAKNGSSTMWQIPKLHAPNDYWGPPSILILIGLCDKRSAA